MKEFNKGAQILNPVNVVSNIGNSIFGEYDKKKKEKEKEEEDN
jgi:hypothetical protein